MSALSGVAYSGPVLNGTVIYAARVGGPSAQIAQGAPAHGAKMPAHAHIHTGSNLFVGSSDSNAHAPKACTIQNFGARASPRARDSSRRAPAYLRRSSPDRDEVEEDELDGR